ncbi:hypothetical protein B0H34DRAFT_714125 [Crassisporium funariophilum]|nr:hypothetical protein B0H34DRAFT_714125 [Crassisporium funariophilum]
MKNPNSSLSDSSSVTSSPSAATTLILSSVSPPSNVNEVQQHNGNLHRPQPQGYTSTTSSGPGAVHSGSSPSDPVNAVNATATDSERPLAEIVNEQFPAFDATKVVIGPYEAEAMRDAKFQEELSDMLLDVILETHAWAAARPKRQADLRGEGFEKQISGILETEREQGMSMCSPAPSSASSFSFASSLRLRDRIVEKTRENMANFVRKMKMALAMLTGVNV